MASGTRLELIFNGIAAYVDVPDGALIFDGCEFKEPAVANYVFLKTDPTVGELLVKSEEVSLSINSGWKILVNEIYIVPDTTENPGAIYVIDPSDGLCICGVTCQGVELKYVQVFTTFSTN